MFITFDNRPVNNNDTLFFNDTSVGLSSSLNLYGIFDTELEDINIKFANSNDTISSCFKLYSLPRSTYKIAVTVSTATSYFATINAVSFQINANDDKTAILNSLLTAIQNTNNFSNAAIVNNEIVFEARQSGVVFDNAIIDNTVTVAGVTFETTVIEPADEILTTASALTIDKIDYYKRSGKYVYKINILFEPEYEAGLHDENYSYKHDTILEISTVENSIETTLTLGATARAIHQDAKLIVALQNFKKHITEDYYQSFFESELNGNAQDEVLLNRKRREYLLVLFELTGFIGSYRSLTAAIEYFGWGELLTIREYWKSLHASTYKLTDIKNQVLDNIDKQLHDYKKTNQMSLSYKINEFQNTFDEDGLPIYVNVLTDTDTVLTKLHSLKRVLEQDFVTLNTDIIEIAGEISAVVGQELSIWLNNAIITDVRLTEAIHSPIVWHVVHDTVYIQDHRVITYPFAYQVLDATINHEKLQFVSNSLSLATNTNTFIDVLEIVNDDSLQQDFDYATKYLRSDFGLIELVIDEIDTTLYQSFRYLVYEFDTNNELFRSINKPIDQLGNGIKVGAHMLGDIKLVLVLFDWYGGISVVSLETKISIVNRPIEFFIAKHDIDGKYKDLELLSTFESRSTDDENYVVDSLSETLDVNTYNQMTNLPQMTILKNYSTKFDIASTYTQVNQLNSLPIEYLQTIPVEVWGYKYGTAIIDVIGNGLNGARVLQAKAFLHHNWSAISLPYSSTTFQTKELYLQQLITTLNNQPATSIWRKFTYDINYYSNVPEALLTDARPMLRVKAIDKSLTIDHFWMRISSTTFKHLDFPTMIDKNDVLVFSVIDTMNVVTIKPVTVRPAMTTFKIQLGNLTYTTTAAFLNINELKMFIENWKIANNLTTISIWLRDNCLVISCQEDFYMSHQQLGVHRDIFRGAEGTKIIRTEDGDDIKLAEPVYAFLNDFSKMNSANVEWTLSNALTNEIIAKQYSQAFRYVITKTGSYTLSVSSTDRYGTTTTTKNGVYLVQNSL